MRIRPTYVCQQSLIHQSLKNSSNLSFSVVLFSLFFIIYFFFLLLRYTYNVPDRITGRSGLEELKQINPHRQWNFVEVNIAIKVNPQVHVQLTSVIVQSPHTVMDVKDEGDPRRSRVSRSSLTDVNKLNLSFMWIEC